MGPRIYGLGRVVVGRRMSGRVGGVGPRIYGLDRVVVYPRVRGLYTTREYHEVNFDFNFYRKLQKTFRYGLL